MYLEDYTNICKLHTPLVNRLHTIVMVPDTSIRLARMCIIRIDHGERVILRTAEVYPQEVRLIRGHSDLVGIAN